MTSPVLTPLACGSSSGANPAKTLAGETIGSCMVYDAFHRPLRDLRLSVTDSCQLRCLYCRPQRRMSKHSTVSGMRQNSLTIQETMTLVEAFADLGVTKIRLTGGEPLLYPELISLIQQISGLKKITDIALTTNGLLLKRFAHPLKAAGLKRLTISLDTVNDDLYKSLSGSRHTARTVLDGIRMAERAGFRPLKINAVIVRGRNDRFLLEMADHFRFSGHILRFIEYMDAGNINGWQRYDVVSAKKIFERLNARWPLVAVEPTSYGETAKRWRFKDGGGEIGFIASISEPFCGTCTRARLTADGRFSTCLFAEHVTDLGNYLRAGCSVEHIAKIIARHWQGRADKYSENRSLFRALPAASQKLEMYQIGG